MSDDSTTQCLLFPGIFRKPIVAQFDQRERAGAVAACDPLTVEEDVRVLTISRQISFTQGVAV